MDGGVNIFPVITHIDDVLPHVAGRADFVVAHRDGYIYVDYNFTQDDTFFGHGAEFRKECRGLKFYPDGRLMARPLGKFFNVSERPDTQPNILPWDEPHHVLTKRDGSMIHTAIVDGKTRLMTRAGITEVALQTEDWLWNRSGIHERYDNFFTHMEECGFTPIFEYTSPKNRIVLKYEDTSLTLLAIRDKYTGEYVLYDRMCQLAAHYDVPCVDAWSVDTSNAGNFVKYVSSMTGIEGCVVRWSDGRMVKLKCEEYVAYHRAKDGLQHEKNVLSLVINNKDDDVISMLPPEDAERLKEYAMVVRASVVGLANRIEAFVDSHRQADRKVFATEHLHNLPRLLHPIAWAVYDGRDALGALNSLILRHCGSQTDVEKVRDIIGVRWNG